MIENNVIRKTIYSKEYEIKFTGSTTIYNNILYEYIKEDKGYFNYDEIKELLKLENKKGYETTIHVFSKKIYIKKTKYDKDEQSVIFKMFYENDIIPKNWFNGNIDDMEFYRLEFDHLKYINIKEKK